MARGAYRRCAAARARGPIPSAGEFRFVVEFPFPDQASRPSIREAHLPGEAPLGPDVDMDNLARELKVSGGSIRNITLNAAFLAAANGHMIGMEQLGHATRREFEKTGKLWSARPDAGGRAHA